MKSEEEITAIFQEWYDSLRRRKNGKLNSFPTQGALCVALVILEHLKENFNLDIDAHMAKSGTQITGLSAGVGQALLKRYGENRLFSSEWGRTSRGSKKYGESVLEFVSKLDMGKDSKENRNKILDNVQRKIAQIISEYLNQDHIKFEYDSRKSARQLIKEIMKVAKDSKKDAYVAQYLIGAKLQLRFPRENISNESLTTSDLQSGRKGDFLLGDTVFHITLNPTEALMKKCISNIRESYKVFLIVSDEAVDAARFMAEKNTILDLIAIESIESFVSQNLEELSKFERKEFVHKFVELISLYNQRVDETEKNKSVMIDIPENLDLT